MKIAFATTKGGLDDHISMSFGRTPTFTIVDGEHVEVVQNPGASASRGAGVSAANFLKSLGVEMVIAGRFGPNAIRALESLGINYKEAQGKVKDFVNP